MEKIALVQISPFLNALHSLQIWSRTSTLTIGNIFKEGELKEESVRKESLLTAADGKNYRTKIYNLDVIISVGYRVKSNVGTCFRQWALAVLKDYLLRGYAVHQQALVLQQINLRIDAQNDRLARIEDTVSQQQQQIDFVVHANEKPKEPQWVSAASAERTGFDRIPFDIGHRPFVHLSDNG